MKTNFCDRGSGWACNELGIHRATLEGDPAGALRAVNRSCDLRFPQGCENIISLTTGDTGLIQAQPQLEDLPIILRGSKAAVQEQAPEKLYTLGCSRGWIEMCDDGITDQPVP